jgi:hypothetical protein
MERAEPRGRLGSALAALASHQTRMKAIRRAREPVWIRAIESSQTRS